MKRTYEQILLDTAQERHRAIVDRALQVPEIAAALRKTFPGQKPMERRSDE